MNKVLVVLWASLVCMVTATMAQADQPDAPVVVARSAADTLQQRALQSSLAARSMLMALTRAGERLVAVGIRGHILYSDDQGQNWKQASVPVAVTLTGVCFADRRTGWAIGHRGVILKSTDGGESWIRQLDGVKAAQSILQLVQQQDPSRTQNARRLLEEGADKPLLDIQCLDGRRAVAVGAYGLGFSTLDGGSTWAPSLDLLEGTEQRHINVVRTWQDKLYLAGEQGGLFRINRDLTGLERLGEPYTGSFFGLLISRKDSLLAFGLRGNVFRSTDAGVTWTPVAITTSQSLTAGVNLADGSLLLVDESGGGWLSHDDGLSFKPVKPTSQFPFTALIATDQGGGVAVGAQGVSFFEPSALR